MAFIAPKKQVPPVRRVVHIEDIYGLDNSQMVFALRTAFAVTDPRKRDQPPLGTEQEVIKAEPLPGVKLYVTEIHTNSPAGVKTRHLTIQAAVDDDAGGTA